MIKIISPAAIRILSISIQICLANQNAFYFAEKPPQMRRVGRSVVPDLPAFRINPEAMTPIVKGEEQMSLNQYYDLTGTYRKYRDLPQCRYFAFEYKNRIYHIFNAYFYPMGRMIDKIATLIRGRASPHYRNNVADIKNGDICIIVNAQDPLFTGKKLLFKNFKYHTGFVGHLKTFSYRSVLNKKPQLLYYYLLRKSMPKNKISEQYMKNLKIFRGPTHGIKNIPQFAPMKFIQKPITQIDFKQYVQNNKDNVELIFQAKQGSKTTIRGDVLPQQLKTPDKTLSSQNQNFSYQRKTQMKNVHNDKQMLKFVRRQKQVRRRYRTVRAPYPRKPDFDPGYKMFYSEKEAMKSPYYEELANEQLPEVQQEHIEDPLKRKGWDK